jgi:hypothetical protein
MKSNITSKQYSDLKASALNLIGDLRNAQLNLAKVHTGMSELGINLAIGDKESELAFLARIASEATEQEHDMLKREALEEITATTQGESYRRQPSSWLGRKMGKIAQAIG